jgi:hypothetical protein
MPFRAMRRRAVICAACIASGCSAVLLAAACGSSESTSPPDVVEASALDAGRDRRPPPDDPDADVDASVSGPMLLSQTGLYSDFASRTVASGLFAYAPRYEFWADGAEKSRWLYLPPGTTIDTSRIDHWEFPVGTKAFKELRYGGKPIETRLLMKVASGTGNKVWWEAAYVWKADGSDAVATLAGARQALGTTHDVPTQIDCNNCHGDVSDVLIGVSAIQLSDPTTNPLAVLASAGRLSTAPPAGIDVPGTGNVKDTLGYLHANCGHCHNDQSPKLSTQTKMRLRLVVGQTPEQTGAFTTTVGTVMKHPIDDGDGGFVTDVLVKGDPERSGLWRRMARRDAYGMPPAGTQVVDDAGLATIEQWIRAWQ